MRLDGPEGQGSQTTMGDVVPFVRRAAGYEADLRAENPDWAPDKIARVAMLCGVIERRTAAIVELPIQSNPDREASSGPPASILAFPATLNGEALLTRYAWLVMRHREWGIEEVDEDVRPILGGVAHLDLGADEDRMRYLVREWTARIEKRAQVKDWLASMGADRGQVTDAESALFFIYDRFAGKSDLPPSA